MMTPALERPRWWQVVLAVLLGALLTMLTVREDREAHRLIAEGTRVEARILSAAEGRRGGTPTTCHVEFSFLLPGGGDRRIRDSAPNSECRRWERQLARGQKPIAEAIVGRDGTALLRVEAEQRSDKLTMLAPLTRFLIITAAVLLISMVIRAYLPSRT